MTEQNLAAADIDTKTPNVARIYDYLLGGKDNFAADREAARQLIEAIPDVAAIARDNRSFLGRVVRYLVTEGGIRQFLDLGGGLPTQANVHELAQGVATGVHVVYVDNDPVVASHGQALLAADGEVAMVLGDLRDPVSILGNPEVTRLLDLTQPVAVLCTSTLHFIADEADPHKIMAEYRDHLAPGSYLAITHGTLEEDPATEGSKAEGVYRQASSQLHVRPLPDVLRFFDGFELVEPGLTWIAQWRPEPGTAPTGRQQSMRGGVGRKPRRGPRSADELVVDAAFRGGQRLAGATPAELDKLSGD
jgi:SAM-dependent methyltransferase